MTTSSANVEARSNPTLDCFTDAVLLRERPGAVGIAYVRGSSPPPSSVAATAPPASASASASMGTPTSCCPPPPFARTSAFPAAPPVIVVRAGTSHERDRRARELRALDAQLRDVRAERSFLVEAAATRARLFWWAPLGGVSIGASIASLAAVASVRGALVVAIGTCLMAGLATLAVALSRLRQERTARRRR